MKYYCNIGVSSTDIDFDPFKVNVKNGIGGRLMGQIERL